MKIQTLCSIITSIAVIGVVCHCEAQAPTSNTSGSAPISQDGRSKPPVPKEDTVPNKKVSATIDNLTTWDAKKQGDRLTSNTCSADSIYIATEGYGIWRARTTGRDHRWVETPRKGLVGNDFYSLAMDELGRLWAGSLNHGVFVFNGKTWQGYGPTKGLQGCHVVAIASCPTDGSMWVATESGLNRYNIKSDTWSTFDISTGLPSNSISSIAFDSRGRLYVGTQLDGLAIGSPEDMYATWRTVRCPFEEPDLSSGDGLPSNLINCIYVGRDNNVYVGTDSGLSVSRDQGQTFQYIRGLDWHKKSQEKGLPLDGNKLGASTHETNASSTSSKGEVTTKRTFTLPNLLEDYVTSIYEDTTSRLFVGHRNASVEVFKSDGTRCYPSVSQKQTPNYVRFICPLFGGVTATGNYGEGLKILPLTPTTPEVTKTDAVKAALPSLPVSSVKPPSFPSYPGPPSLAELQHTLSLVAEVAPDQRPETQPLVVALDDDWVTEGSWLGRYGRYWACLCAMASPYDYTWGAGWRLSDYKLQIGPRCKTDDSLRYWVHWLYTNNPHSLELPPTYLQSRLERHLTTIDKNRRQAEVDDHGEAYPTAASGPNIYCSIKVPDGVYYLSMYCFNKDGTGGLNRYRDYTVSIRQHTSKNVDDIGEFANQPELAHARIVDFYGGVWKRFMVKGPCFLTVEINRNHSHNTILSAITLDLVDQDPPPYFHSVAEWDKTKLNEEIRRRQLISQFNAHKNGVSEAEVPANNRDLAERLFNSFADLEITNPAAWAQRRRPVYGVMSRWYQSQIMPNTILDSPEVAHLGTCYYHLDMYESWETNRKVRKKINSREIEKSLPWDGISGSGDEYRVLTDYLPTLLKD